MYEFRQIHNKLEWDSFIASTPYPTTFIQSWNWGVFQNKHHRQNLSYGIYQDGKQVGGFLGIIIKAKRGRYLYIRNGPVLDWSDAELVSATIDFLKRLGNEHELWHIRISPLVAANTAQEQVLNSHHFPTFQMHEVEALDTWILDLTQTEEQILENMRKNTRYYIRKAEKDGVEVISTDNLDYIDDFFAIYRDTNERQKFTGYSKEYIASEFSTFAEDGSARMFLAKYEGKFIAAAIFVYYGNSAYYHYSGALSEYRKISAPYLIQWKSIQHAKQLGLSRYNFWGIAPLDKPNHPWKGLEFFKTGFGGWAERWVPARDIPINPRYWLTNLYERYDKFRKGY